MARLKKILQHLSPEKKHLLLLFLLGLIIFSTHQIVVLTDMSKYMVNGLNIINGNGYRSSDGSYVLSRGPLFPYMIAISFWLFGPSPWSAFWIVRLFCILNPLMIYLLGKRLYNRWVALAAALMTLTSYTVNFRSYTHIDVIWPFFILLAMYLFWDGLEREKYRYFLLSGISLAAAFLVKEVAILFFPAPALVMLTVRKYHNVTNLKKLFLLYTALTICILPWVVFQLGHGDIGVISGKSTPTLSRGMISVSEGNSPYIFKLVKKYIMGFVHYYRGIENSLSRHILPAPLFVLAWLFLLVRVFKSDIQARLIMIFTLCYLPIFYLSGVFNLRIGQGIVFFLISYLVLAYSFWYIAHSGVKRLPQKWQDKNAFNPISIFIILTSSVILTQSLMSTSGAPNGITFYKKSLLYQFLATGTLHQKVGGVFCPYAEQAGLWIKENIPTGSRFTVSNPVEGRGSYFYADGLYPLHFMPVKQTSHMHEISPLQKNDAIIFLASWRPSLDPRNKIIYMVERDLIKHIVDEDIQYVLVGSHRNFLSLYFDANPAFEKIKQFGKGEIKLYKVKVNPDTISYPTTVLVRLGNYLKRLKQNKSQKYKQIEKEIFIDILKKDIRYIEEIIRQKNSSRMIFVFHKHIYGKGPLNNRKKKEE
jgi:4-amino-4-deoxy-L-arabinose transferase-like glycosyltransferase